MRIGFVGAGAMGGPMAARLLAGGFAVHVYDPAPAAVERLVRLGATAAETPRAAATGADVCFGCLPSPAVSRAVVFGPDGILAAEGLEAYVEMSTIGSETVIEIGAALAGRGVLFVDAPVSGGPKGAEAGSLTVMASGSDAAFGHCEPALRTIAANLFHVGREPGQGQVAKLANNMISAAAMCASFEAITMGVKAGLDADTLVDLINVSTGRSGATLDKFPKAILPRTFDYGGKLGTMYKDVSLCLAEYRARNVPHHVSASVAQIWFQGMAQGRGDDDYTSLIKVIEDWAGVEVRGRAAGENRDDV